MFKLQVIIGSTRQGRFSEKSARWISDLAAQRAGIQTELVDLRDYPLPFFDEVMSLEYSKGQCANPLVQKWGAKVAEADAYIFTAAEYNHACTAVLKNALDYAYFEWGNKPVSFVGHGGVGGARAVEQLRLIAVELQMAPIRYAVHIGLEPFVQIARKGADFSSFEHLMQSADKMLNQLTWWAKALKAAREQPLG